PDPGLFLCGGAVERTGHHFQGGHRQKVQLVGMRVGILQAGDASIDLVHRLAHVLLLIGVDRERVGAACEFYPYRPVFHGARCQFCNSSRQRSISATSSSILSFVPGATVASLAVLSAFRSASFSSSSSFTRSFITSHMRLWSCACFSCSCKRWRN